MQSEHTYLLARFAQDSAVPGCRTLSKSRNRSEGVDQHHAGQRAQKACWVASLDITAGLALDILSRETDEQSLI